MQDRVLSMLGLAAKAGKLCSGEFAVEKSIKEEKARLVIVAADASDNTKKHFRDMCGYRSIPLVFYGNKEDLGHAIGQRFRTNIAVLDENFASSIREMLESIK